MISRVKYEDANQARIEQLSLEAGTPFSLQAYALAVHKNWYVYYLKDYRAAILIPYAEVGHYQWCATPLFYRASYWLGTWKEEEKQALLTQLQKDFVYGDLNFGESVSGDFESKIKVHQIIDPKSFSGVYGSQAKRMLQKSLRLDLRYLQTFELDLFLDLVREELSPKVEGLNDKALVSLKNLLVSLNQSGLLRLESAWRGEEFQGAIAIVQLPKTHLYIKGTATVEAKKQGVFYALMHRSIQHAMEQNALFDFGGSSVEGVAQFNRNFGALDRQYAALSWGKMPFALKLARKLKNLW